MTGLDTAGARAGHRPGWRRLAATGPLAIVAAMAATALAAGLALAGGVDFEISDGGETIPLSGIVVVTGVFSAIGLVIAGALLRWSARPATAFVRVTAALTALSMAPPLLTGADAATAAALIGLHLLAAAVVIPALTRALAGTPEA